MDKLYAINLRALAGTIKEEGWAFIFICAYLFFEYVRPQSIYPGVNVLPWVPVVLFLALVTGLIRSEFGQKEPCALNKLLVVYAAVVLLSSVLSTHPDISFGHWRMFFDWFIIYFLIVSLVTNERRFYIFFLSFLLYSFKMSQHGFLSWARRGFAYDSWGVTGAPGWFHNSGELGIQMCIFTPLAIAFIVAVYRHLAKPWLAFFLLMPLSGIGAAIASSSRGALVGLGAAGLWAILRRPKRIILGMILLGVCAVVVMRVMPEEFTRRFTEAGADRTSLHRLERWGHSLEAMNEHPLLGVGFAAWTEYYPRNFRLHDQGTLLVHNVFLQCGTELGYAGLGVFAAMILACLAATRRVRRLAKGAEDRFPALIAYGLDAALVGFLVSGSFVTVLYYPYFWIQCALTASLYTAAVKKYAAAGRPAEAEQTACPPGIQAGSLENLSRN